MNKLNNVNVIHFIHFHACFSSREGRWGSSLRSTWSTHGQQQFSGSSTGSTQRRDQAKARDVVISPGAGRSLGHGFGQKDLPRQAFMGYSGRMAEAT